MTKMRCLAVAGILAGIVCMGACLSALLLPQSPGVTRADGSTETISEKIQGWLHFLLPVPPAPIIVPVTPPAKLP